MGLFGSKLNCQCSISNSSRKLLSNSSRSNKLLDQMHISRMSRVKSTAHFLPWKEGANKSPHPGFRLTLFITLIFSTWFIQFSLIGKQKFKNIRNVTFELRFFIVGVWFETEQWCSSSFVFENFWDCSCSFGSNIFLAKLFVLGSNSKQAVRTSLLRMLDQIFAPMFVLIVCVLFLASSAHTTNSSPLACKYVY